MTKRSGSATPYKVGATGTWGFVTDLGLQEARRCPACGTEVWAREHRRNRCPSCPAELSAPFQKRRQVRRQGFATKSAAQRELDQLKVDVRSATYVAPQRQRVGAFFDEWLEAKARSLKSSTHASYRRYIALHVKPHIGHLVLQELDAGTLTRLYGELLDGGRADGKAGGLSPRSVRYIATIIGAALGDAVKWGRLVRNPADAAEAPKAKTVRDGQARFDAWTVDELNAFLNAERDKRYWTAWRFLAMTGCRRGEALGLRWSDVDLETGQISIRRTLGAVEHRIETSTPKSGRARSFTIDADTLADLRVWRATILQDRLLLGAGYVDEDLVFCHPTGAPFHPERFSREFDRAVERHGLRKIRLHDLRHGWATMALAAGVHPKVVSERLGHAGIAITLDLYSHVSAEIDAGAAETVANLLRGASGD